MQTILFPKFNVIGQFNSEIYVGLHLKKRHEAEPGFAGVENF